MKKTIMSRSRRIMLSLILVLSIAAVASIIKVQAAGVITGWLGGWSEDANIGGSLNTWPPEGNETGVGWISLNGTTQDGHDYSVNIPSGADALTGYAWANAGGNPDNGAQNGLGWIDFNPQDHCVAGSPSADQYQAASCTPPSGSAGVFRDSNNHLYGWARFVSIAKATVAPSNSGGWNGWIKMAADGGNWNDMHKDCRGHNPNDYKNNEPCNYGVYIDTGNNNKLKGYAWNGEESLVLNSPSQNNMANGLGWIDFSRARVENVCAITNNPSVTMNANTCTEMDITLEDQTDGELIELDDKGSTLIDLSCNSSCTGAAGVVNCPISGSTLKTWVKGSTTAVDVMNIPVDISGFCGDKTATVNLLHVPKCIVDAPDSVEVRAGSTATYDVTVTREAGETASCVLENCVLQAGASSNITDASKVSGESKCSVTASTASNYGSGEVKATAGTGEDTTDVFVKAPGWVEATPSR